MNSSSPSKSHWSRLSLVLVLFSALVLAALAPASADAQAADKATATLVVSDAVVDQPFQTVALSLKAGNVGLAAIEGTLGYDADVVTMISCEISEAGACNAGAAEGVRVSMFNLSGLGSNDQLMTVNFAVVPGATGTSTFTFDLQTVVNSYAVDLDPITVDPVEFSLAPAQVGSATGDVVAADSKTGLYNIDVCAVHTSSATETCTTSSGLGTWRFDDLGVGDYTIVVSDSSGIYAGTSIAATVAPDEIATGLGVALTFAADEVAEEPNDAASTPPVAILGTPPLPPTTPLATVDYQASIAGQISAIDTAQPIEGLQVCATQPLVLHQSCSPTDASGSYALTGLSAGNYWVTVTDPFARFEDSATKLVGVIGDDGQTTSVNLQVARIG